MKDSWTRQQLNTSQKKQYEVKVVEKQFQLSEDVIKAAEQFVIEDKLDFFALSEGIVRRPTFEVTSSTPTGDPISFELVKEAINRVLKKGPNQDSTFSYLLVFPDEEYAKEYMKQLSKVCESSSNSGLSQYPMNLWGYEIDLTGIRNPFYRPPEKFLKIPLEIPRILSRMRAEEAEAEVCLNEKSDLTGEDT